MADKHDVSLPSIKWIILVSLSIVMMLFIVGKRQSAQSGALAAQPDLPTFDSPIGNPVLDLDKTVDDAAPQPGDTIDYTLAYANTAAGSQAFNVRLYDFLPAGVEFLSASQPPDVNADGLLMFTAPSVGPGTTPTSVTISVRVLSGHESLYNQALVTADGVTPTTAAILVNPVAATGHLTLTQSGTPITLLNGDIVYTLRCENTGPVAYHNVEVVDVLPGGTSLVDTTIPPGSAEQPFLRWPVGTLLPAAIWEVSLTVTPSQVGIVTNTATLNAPTHTSLHALATTSVITEGIILAIDKTGRTAAAAGDELVYTLTYSNTGNKTASGVIVTDTLPAGVTVVDTAPLPASTGGGQWTWNVAALAPATGGTIVITTTIDNDTQGALTNVATIGAPGALTREDVLITTIEARNIYLPLVMRATASP